MKKAFFIILITLIMAAFSTFAFRCFNGNDPDPSTDTPVAECEHKYVKSKVVKPTCTESGYTLYVCSKCNDKKQDDQTEPLGHSMGGWKTTKQPGCETDGLRESTCMRCVKYTETETIPQTGHDYVAFKFAANCITRGYTMYQCSVCKDKYYDEFTDLTDHKWTDKKLEQTGENSFRESRNCTTCGLQELFDVTDPVIYDHTHKDRSYDVKIQLIFYKNAKGEEKIGRKEEVWLGDTQSGATKFYASCDYTTFEFSSKKYVVLDTLSADGATKPCYTLQDDVMYATEAAIPSFKIDTYACLFESRDSKTYTTREKFGDQLVFYLGTETTIADLPEPPEYEGYVFDGWQFNEGALEGKYLNTTINAYYYAVKE